MSSPTSPVSLSEIGQIALTMADIPRATAFYRDVLGLRFLFSAGPNMAFFAAGSIRLMLTTAQGAGKPGKNSILYFKTADIRATYRTILDRGATAASEPQMVAKLPDHELWLAAVRDPEGNVIELMSEVRGA
jgi:predicted enzyme related to lactoylglutathione lyase